jgi:predicted DNA-binding protein (UPF0251 family)
MGDEVKSESVTIEHVAAVAGVSRQTVSRVINRGPNVKEAVSKRKALRITLLRCGTRIVIDSKNPETV